MTWRLCREYRVVEHSRGVDDGVQRMLGGYLGQEGMQRISVRRITRLDPHRRTERRELRFDRGGAVGCLALSADEQQVSCAMTSHQVPGEHHPEHAGTARDGTAPAGSSGRGTVSTSFPTWRA